MFDERTDGIESAVEVVSDWLNGNENPLTWNPPTYAGLWIWCLAHNLTIAAGLCAAFDLGKSYGAERVIASWNGGGWTYPFHPGCGRKAGGG
jgi:hypothetical protein